MSLSTTTTTTYEITKYSRAYNHASNPLSGQPDLQWQHFVNPVIRLTLDARKSGVGHLESYRLKIIWTFNAELNSMDVDQREVVFEDLDLVTYSSMPSLQGPQGMPLKAVYQDSTVGLRYQHPRVIAPGTTPQYRRFQVVFESAASAIAFVDSIRFICPCKANAAPPPRVPRAPVMQARAPAPRSSLAPQTATAHPMRPPLRPSASAMSVNEPLPAIRRTSTTPSLPPFSALSASQDLYHTQTSESRGSSGVHQYPPPPDTGYGNSALQDAYNSSRPSSAVTASSAVAHYSSDLSSSAFSVGPTVPVAPTHRSSNSMPGGSLDRLLNKADPPQTQPAAAPVACRTSGSSDTSLPSSSFPHSSSSPPLAVRPRPSSPDLMPPPPVPTSASRVPNARGAASHEPSSRLGDSAASARGAEDVPAAARVSGADSARDITAALRGSEGLYDLSKADLERLVSEVIREEGFADLMKALDGMWRVKGLMGMA
ncbi:hypothetical protein C8Q79DRAFT_1001419 [Trametes meyenii]|nr:hypothetical protein C8Q79DRAFT_1001419 [Trametes meyenii]